MSCCHSRIAGGGRRTAPARRDGGAAASRPRAGGATARRSRGAVRRRRPAGRGSSSAAQGGFEAGALGLPRRDLLRDRAAGGRNRRAARRGARGGRERAGAAVSRHGSDPPARLVASRGAGCRHRGGMGAARSGAAASSCARSQAARDAGLSPREQHAACSGARVAREQAPHAALGGRCGPQRARPGPSMRRGPRAGRAGHAAQSGRAGRAARRTGYQSSGSRGVLGVCLHGSHRLPAVASVEPRKCACLQAGSGRRWRAMGAKSACQAQGRRFDPDHPLSKFQGLGASSPHALPDPVPVWCRFAPRLGCPTSVPRRVDA